MNVSCGAGSGQLVICAEKRVHLVEIVIQARFCSQLKCYCRALGQRQNNFTDWVR